MLTFQEVKERLKSLDEVILCEILDISSEDIVERFEHNIYIRMEELIEELADEPTDTD